jgi:hypothetical protein
VCASAFRRDSSSSLRFDPTTSKIQHAQILYAGINDFLNASQHVAQCGVQLLGAILIGGTKPSGYAGPAISDTLIAHSLSNGIASDSGDDGTHLTTDFASRPEKKHAS